MYLFKEIFISVQKVIKSFWWCNSGVLYLFQARKIKCLQVQVLQLPIIKDYKENEKQRITTLSEQFQIPMEKS